jgi:hypothetical protein
MKMLVSVSLVFIYSASLFSQPWEPGQAGISDETSDHINTMQYSEEVLDHPSFQNCLAALVHSEAVPSDAIELTTVDDFTSMTSGNTYVIRGNFTITKEIKIPSRCTVYVDGSIHRDGNFNGEGENSTDVIFRILSGSNINLFGVNNARLTGNHKVTAVYVDKSKNVTVQGFDIGDMWEGLVARKDNTYITFKNNYIHGISKRAIWIIVSHYCEVVHNFCDMPGYDGVDFDAFAKNNIAFENVSIGAGRWAGFVEEAAAENKFIRNIGIMKNNPGLWQMGWADNGTTEKVYNNSGQLTRDNYFVDNLMIEPREFTNKDGGGDYFAKASTVDDVLLKGMTYFWRNTGYGCGKGSRMDNAEWRDTLPQEGADWIDELDAKYNTASSIKTNTKLQPNDSFLFQNYPNPFNPETTIRYSLTAAQDVKLYVCDTFGRIVRTVVDQYQGAGHYEIKFDARELASGVYVFTLRTPNIYVSKRMLVLK